VEARKRILAADDDRIVRRLLSVNLERWGYEVILATNGTEAWEMLQRDDAPEIVILDWVMPGMDGVEICRRLRARSDRRYHYVLLLSGKQKKSDLIEAFESGADDYLTKPLHLRELELRLNAGLRAVQSRRKGSDVPAPVADDDEKLPTTNAPFVDELAPQSPSDAALAGSVIAGRWRVTRPIAGGGMGTVWEGEHTSLGTRVAIKFIRAEYAENRDAVERFAEEARTTAQIQSRHAVKVFDYGVTPGGMPYLVMEYLEGLSITDEVTEHGPISAEQVAVFISQTAHALGKAHAAGIIHRDVKPDNIMLVPDDEAPPGAPRRMAKLVDFGVAKVLAGTNPVTGNALRRATAAGMIVGTPAFMSPEQLLGTGEADRHADLWGLATSAYVAVTAQLPYDGRNLGELVNQVCLNPPPVPSEALPDVTPGFDEWFARACANKPADRFDDAFAMSAAILAACGPRARTSVESPAPEPASRSSVEGAPRPSAPRLSNEAVTVRARREEVDALLQDVPPKPSVSLAPRVSGRPSVLAPRQQARMALTFALGVVVAVGAMLVIR
jgi:serine/threonine protein kinase/CheY-like chemotaxis protein